MPKVVESSKKEALRSKKDQTGAKASQNEPGKPIVIGRHSKPLGAIWSDRESMEAT